MIKTGKNLLRPSDSLGSLLVLFLCVFGYSGWSAAQTESTRTPEVISADIANRLEIGFAVKNLRVGVRVEQGVAYLYGQTDNLLTKERAETLAAGVLGVVAVSNDIQVAIDNPPSDPALAAEVAQRLADNPIAETAKVDIQVAEGKIFLVGTVVSHAQRALITAAIKAVPGVIAVEDQLLLVNTRKRSDQDILVDIIFNIAWRTWANPTYVEAEVVDGEVTLSGVVGRVSIKQNVIEHAWVFGVSAVQAEQLVVNPDYDKSWLREPVNNSQELANAIRHAYSADPFTSDPRHEINAKLVEQHGETIVRLHGSTDNLFVKERAAKLARSVFGIDKVVNELVVIPAKTPGDYETALLVKAERLLIKDPYVRPRDIKITFSDGTIIIEGQVASEFQKVRAGNLLTQLRYLDAIENNLSVDSQAPGHDFTHYLQATGDESLIWYMPTTASKINDQEIVHRIHQTMIDYGVFDLGAIEIVASTGIATLSGPVVSVQAKALARNIAYGAGARGVINRLHVASDPKI